MRRIIKMAFRRIGLSFLILTLYACSGSKSITVSTEQPQPDGNENMQSSLTLDEAIGEASAYFSEKLHDNAKIALLPFDTSAGRLSDYILEELWTRLEAADKFIMVDRRNLDRIDTEVQLQLESGRVDDELAVSITKQYGAEILIFGQLSPLDRNSPETAYRLTVYAADVEKAASSQRTYTIRSDNRLESLLNASMDEEIDRAVAVMAQAVSRQTSIAVGRIVYGGTQSVSGLSARIKSSIISSAQKYRDKFRVASDTESAGFAVASRGLTVVLPVSDSSIEAVITGSYLPLDNGAEVTLQLVSTGAEKTVLASPRFVISAQELERRKLSLLPEKNNVPISLGEFEEKQKSLAPYANIDNPWIFTVTPDVLDGIYYAGDFMSMCVYSERDCYFRIIHIDVNGNTQVIYPVAQKDNNFIRAGETRSIPDNTLYLMGPPFGEEIILVAAYDQPFTVNTPAIAAPLSAEIITRSFTVESDSQVPMNPSATAKFSYTILPGQD